MSLYLASFLLEEFFHHFCTFLLQYSAGHFCLRVKHPVSNLLKSSFFVLRSIHDSPYLCPSCCPCAHRAGLNSHIQCAFWQILASQGVCCRCEGHHLCMCRNVVQSFCVVVCPCHNLPIAHYHRSYGNLFLIGCCFCLFQRLAHIKFVFVVEYAHSQFFWNILISAGRFLK